MVPEPVIFAVSNMTAKIHQFFGNQHRTFKRTTTISNQAERGRKSRLPDWCDIGL